MPGDDGAIGIPRDKPAADYFDRAGREPKMDNPMRVASPRVFDYVAHGMPFAGAVQQTPAGVFLPAADCWG
jgi:hypothetical protein